MWGWWGLVGYGGRMGQFRLTLQCAVCSCGEVYCLRYVIWGREPKPIISKLLPVWGWVWWQVYELFISETSFEFSDWQSILLWKRYIGMNTRWHASMGDLVPNNVRVVAAVMLLLTPIDDDSLQTQVIAASCLTTSTSSHPFRCWVQWKLGRCWSPATGSVLITGSKEFRLSTSPFEGTWCWLSWMRFFAFHVTHCWADKISWITNGSQSEDY